MADDVWLQCGPPPAHNNLFPSLFLRVDKQVIHDDTGADFGNESSDAARSWGAWVDLGAWIFLQIREPFKKPMNFF